MKLPETFTSPPSDMSADENLDGRQPGSFGYLIGHPKKIGLGRITYFLLHRALVV